MKHLISYFIFSIFIFSFVACHDAVDTTHSEAMYTGDSYEGINSPYIVFDDNLPKLHETIWDCLEFGSYPQAEVINEKFNAVEYYAISEGDTILDPTLFNQLCNANWTSDETIVDGIHYRRLRAENVQHYEPNSTGHYRWKAPDAYHYFKYEPIRWRVANIKGTIATLICDKAMDCRKFNDTEVAVTWETSSLRKWMNDEALQQMFDESQLQCIMKDTVDNSPNFYFGTDCGNDTYDRMYILSESEIFCSNEAKKYGFYPSDGIDDPARRFKTSMYAKCRGAWISPVVSYQGNAFWLLRNVGYTQFNVVYICEFGYIYNRGTLIGCDDAGIVPVIKIDLSKADYTPSKKVSSNDIVQE